MRRSRTIITLVASLALGALTVGPALGALTASPNPSSDGSYTVSGSVQSFNMQQYFRLRESLPDGGTAYHAVPNPRGISESFTGKANGDYTYQAQGCTRRNSPDDPPAYYLGCEDLGAGVTVTVTLSPPADSTPPPTPAKRAITRCAGTRPPGRRGTSLRLTGMAFGQRWRWTRPQTRRRRSQANPAAPTTTGSGRALSKPAPRRGHAARGRTRCR